MMKNTVLVIIMLLSNPVLAHDGHNVANAISHHWLHMAEPVSLFAGLLFMVFIMKKYINK